jgi:SP family arabinose:H+ symporter-like MFS transporter
MSEQKTANAAGARSNGRGYLCMIAAVAALGGLLLGYDTAVISGAIGFIEAHFKLTAGLTGWAVSSLLIGCMLGAISGGPLSDRFGRKPMLIFCGVIFALSGLGSAVAPNLAFYTWSRLLGGLGIGAVSLLSPLYLAEVAPHQVRGRLVSLYQLAIVVGILVSFLVNMLVQRHGATLPPVHGETWNQAHGWRWMLGLMVVPSTVFGLLLAPLPESPRWQMKRGRRLAAEMTLRRIGGLEAAAKEIEEMEQSLKNDEGKFSELFAGGFGRAMLIGIGLAIFSQFGGINAIMYYGPELFKAAGSNADQAFLSTVVLGATLIVATLSASALVDKLGRRKLLIAGVLLQSACLAAVGILYRIHASPLLLLVFVVLFLIGFGGSTGVVTWVIISEIFPTRLRGQAMGIAVFMHWVADYLVSQTFPVLKEGIGPSNTFFCYAVGCFLGLIFTICLVPETKGRTLEEIEKSWKQVPRVLPNQSLASKESSLS